ncbi:aminotransferase class V-fold PLP-dependent enzyme [Streptosporangium nondiastaticum]|uniref:aminotransferase class V-fold PLP-dependent enzyme n=1 Tax=Streptosporangium nondiastaticum TaxID=35764 RepID=UPI00256FC831|nr:aminotransferase class V-fold PLP-dependent enzyme [Streptosporangium nondiastaticum]
MSFNVDGVHPHDVGGRFNSSGIAGRTGVHCAASFMNSLGTLGSVGASFGVYNSMSEVELFIEPVWTMEKGFWSNEYPNDLLLPS